MDDLTVDDVRLAERLTRGEPAAMALLVERHHVPVYRFLRHLTRRVEDAEDLAQATILRAVAAAHRYDGRAPMRPWIMAIAYREYCHFRRKRLWLPLLADRAAEDPYGRIHDGESLLAALSRLPDDARAVFLLHYVEEMPIVEIAQTLRVPEGTVKSRLYAARQRLRNLLGEEERHVSEPCRS